MKARAWLFIPMSSQFSFAGISAESLYAMYEQDFSGAELTMVYIREWSSDPKGCTRSLVFAVVELLHDALEFGPEIPVGMKDSCLPVNSSCEINLRRVRLSVPEALKWYQGCATGRGEIPLTALERKQGKQSPLGLNLPPFSEEPPWPIVALEAEESFWGEKPFWGHRPGGIRRHQLIAEMPEFGTTLLNKARDWLKRVLPIDIFERPRLLGSVHLVLTNPVFGRVGVRLDRSNTKHIHFSLQRWPGREISNLLLHVTEERPTGQTLLQTVSIESHRTILQLAFEPHMVSFAITSDAHGLLYVCKPFTFVRQIVYNISPQTGVRSVFVPARSRGRPKEDYSVPVSEPPEVVTVDTTPLPSALATLIADDADYRERRHALQLGQRWFDGNVDEATEFVRSLIQSAQKEVFIVDAYFGRIELLRYALATTVRSTKVRILTSHEYLKTKPDENNSTTYAVLLADTLNKLRNQDPALNIEIRVGQGAKAPVHDRFLILDENVWLVGSSLNELGSRGTIIVRLPHSKPVYDVLTQHWKNATSLPDNFTADDTSNLLETEA